MEANAYLATGEGKWLERRNTTNGEIELLLRSLQEEIAHEDQKRILGELINSVEFNRRQKDALIAEKMRNRFTLYDPIRIARRARSTTESILRLEEMRSISIGSLERRRKAAREASFDAAFLLGAAGFICFVFLGVVLYRNIFKPLRVLEERARNWEFGEPWKEVAAPASGEIRSLSDRLAMMTEKLSAQYRSEQELGEMKAKLVSMVSHEFGNALSVLQSVSFLLKESDGAEPAKRARFYDILESNVRSMILATSNLLNMGRLESGRFSINIKGTDILATMHESVKRLEPLWQRKGLEVMVDSTSSSQLVEADVDALSLVVTNLLSNAIKYTPNGGRITMGLRSVEGHPKHLRAFFEDTGIGITEVEQKKISEAFYRADSGKASGSGFGVGLALVKEILDAHKTTLEIESRPGAGSCFSFKLLASIARY